MVINQERRKWNLGAFDLESHNDLEISVPTNSTYAWLCCFYEEGTTFDGKNTFFNTCEDFLDYIEEKSKNNTNYLIYIYNLAFEFSFLYPVLLKRGYTWDDSLEGERTMSSVQTLSCSSVWELTLHVSNKRGLIKFRDLSKFFMGGLGNMAKAFSLPVEKGEIPYEKFRRYEGYIPTEEEKWYLFKDTEIVYLVLEQLVQKNDKAFFTSLSMSSYACYHFLECFDSTHKLAMKKFREDYPIIEDEEEEFLRHSVGGGITYATPRYQCKEIHRKVIHIDKNSMHPSSAVSHDYPYGYGIHRENMSFINEDANKIKCHHIKITYDAVKLHSVIQLIGKNHCSDPYELWVWDFEIETMKKAYVNLEIEYFDYYAYDKKPLAWKQFFIKGYEMKSNPSNDTFTRNRYKLMINSAYGKLLEKTHKFTYIPIIDEQTGCLTGIKEAREDAEISRYCYLPVGSCIPAYSRCDLVETALKIGYQYVTYFDTDSIFFIASPQSIKNYEENVPIGKTLGTWKKEGELTYSFFACAKRYKGIEDGKPFIKAGGFNFKEIDLDIDLTSSKHLVKRRRQAKGGSLIVMVEKEMLVANLNEEEDELTYES